MAVEIVRHSSGPREFVARGIPTFGVVNIYWASRTFGQMRVPMNRRVRDYIVMGGEVGLARNHIVELALAAEDHDPGVRCSHVFFVDDDVLAHPEVLVKLMAHDLPMVAGLYYAKQSVPQPLVLHDEAEGVATKWQPGELVKCFGHGMGITLIRAEVFRRMRDELDLGKDELGHTQWFKTTKGEAIRRPDGTPVYVSETEDVFFCRNAAKLGYQPVVDTSPQAFGFHWEESRKVAYPLDQWKQFNDTGNITWPDTRDGVPVTWGMRETAA